MRTKIIFAVSVLMLLIAACSSEKQQPSSLVTSAGCVPYYTNLADALEAARADQYVVVDFYTDW
jgi:thiol:disulfide interchange protein